VPVAEHSEHGEHATITTTLATSMSVNARLAARERWQRSKA